MAAGGGKVVVDADNAGLVDFYNCSGFKTTGIEGDLSLYVRSPPPGQRPNASWLSCDVQARWSRSCDDTI